MALPIRFGGIDPDSCITGGFTATFDAFLACFLFTTPLFVAFFVGFRVIVVPVVGLPSHIVLTTLDVT